MLKHEQRDGKVSKCDNIGFYGNDQKLRKPRIKATCFISQDQRKLEIDSRAHWGQKEHEEHVLKILKRLNKIQTRNVDRIAKKIEKLPSKPPRHHHSPDYFRIDPHLQETKNLVLSECA